MEPGLAGGLPVYLEAWVAAAATHTHFPPEGMHLILVEHVEVAVP